MSDIVDNNPVNAVGVNNVVVTCQPLSKVAEGGDAVTVAAVDANDGYKQTDYGHGGSGTFDCTRFCCYLGTPNNTADTNCLFCICWDCKDCSCDCGDCTGCDCSGCDCSGVDCSGCDCPACDCSF